MNRSIVLVAVLALLLTGSAATAGDPVLETDDQKTFYALGQAIAQRLGLSQFNLTAEELAYVQAGISDSVMGNESRVDMQAFGPRIQTLAQNRMTESIAKEKKAGMDFVTAEAAKPGAVKLDSGMLYFETAAGTGESPKETDKVKVHYHGTLPDGTVFDSSREGEPVEFPLNGVIGCFKDGIMKMKTGGKSRLVCPSDTAYGDQGSPPSIRPGATLVFEVELIEFGAAAAPASSLPPESPAE